MTPEEKRDSLQKPKKKLKKDRSKLQVKKENPKSSYWKNKALAAWGKYAHSGVDKCAICGRMDIKIDAHHLIGKARVLTRNDPKNCILLCITHHLYDTEISAHMAPLGFTEWLQENRPDMIEYIRENTHRTGKPDYEADYNKLKEML